MPSFPPPASPSRRSRWLQPRWAVPAAALAVASVAVPIALSGRGGHDSGATASSPAATSGAGASPSSAPAPADVTGLPADGGFLDRASAAALTVQVSGRAAAEARATLDGAALPPVRDGDRVAFRPASLKDGAHHLSLTVDGHDISRAFTVDTTPPTLAVDPPAKPAQGTSLALHGTTQAGATVSVNGTKALVSGTGTWQLTLPTTPAMVTVIAQDPAGNTTTSEVSIGRSLPFTRAVHMTALAWSYGPLRDPVLAMAKAGRINAVELDIKDESGLIGYHSSVPLAGRTGATRHPAYDAAKAIKQLHALHIRVIGRVVAFRDPRLCEWAWSHNHRSAVIQDAKTHGPLSPGRYGSCSFTNPADPLARQYNIDLAVEAAKLGFDDILYDYVRRPDGKLSGMVLPGLKGTPESAVAEFVKETRQALDKAGTTTYLGASVFGIAATRPKEIAQSIPALARWVDYIAPMVYPSHWAPGEYGVANPNRQPQAIVMKSLADFALKVKGSPAVVVPWLQDFSLYGVKYGPAQVTAQIRGSHTNHMDSFLLWNASCQYHAAALPVLPPAKRDGRPTT